MVDVAAKTHHCIHAVLGCERPPAISHVVSAPHELEGAGTRVVQIAVAQSYGYSYTVAMIMHQLSREDDHMDRFPLKPWLQFASTGDQFSAAQFTFKQQNVAYVYSAVHSHASTFTYRIAVEYWGRGAHGREAVVHL